MDQIVYLNGKFLPIADARISVLDRGFLFADGIYDVIPVFGGHLFMVDAHLERLAKNLAEIRIPLAVDTQEWRQIFQLLLEKNAHITGNLSIYIEVTRGAPASRSHSFTQDIKPTLLVMLNHAKTLSKDELCQGKAAITIEDQRWQNCHIKSIALLPNILATQAAHDANADEALLIRDGHVVEGASSNVFIVHDDILKTPPLNNHLLPGITRTIILKLAKMHGIAYQEERIPTKTLKDASEIWITSSTREIYPIIRLDGQPVGNGQIGPHWHRMYDLFQTLKADSLSK